MHKIGYPIMIYNLVHDMNLTKNAKKIDNLEECKLYFGEIKQLVNTNSLFPNFSLTTEISIPKLVKITAAQIKIHIVKHSEITCIVKTVELEHATKTTMCSCKLYSRNLQNIKFTLFLCVFYVLLQ